MDDIELAVLASNLETDRVERKASVAEKDRVCEAICAFANDMPGHQQPGVVFIGLQDNGQCAGLEISDRLLLELSSLRSDGNILPFPEISVQRRVVNGCTLAVLITLPSQSPPVRYRGRVWIRIGPRRAIATREEESRLGERRRFGDLPFDHRSVDGSTIDDLDIDLFRRQYLPAALPMDVIAENHRTIEQQLRALHFIGPNNMPNGAGILVLGNDPTNWIPSAYIQFVRFDGVEVTDPILHQRELRGSLADLLRELDDTLATQISIGTSIAPSGSEIREPNYPIAALTQLARNAVMHRSYEATNAPVRIYWYRDRVEILSPGGTFGKVSAENIGDPGITDYRNPLIAEAMKALGFVQRFGIGFPLARKELILNRSPPLEIVVQPSYVLMTIRSRI